MNRNRLGQRCAGVPPVEATARALADATSDDEREASRREESQE
ncbi:MAG: hypothetical protein PUP91_35990 [Rhizonema sp. PD37]|nr:hypothetical protein [Rhizonema sp. PD37]MDF5725760.1 hypothetical protein [Rhizonema sp. PD37]